ncbi:hypothetical protein AB7942_14850 [Neobacillus sp. BF23-41]|uniref:hypothetical protein n=1 Tax=Neobacillus sp. BF23-41 TaxID=3240280 RepID=UPI0034E3B46B
MGLYSILNVEGTCYNCNKNSVLKIQFKYGKLRNYVYQLNDEIIWDKKNKEMRMLELVVLDGIAEACKYCNEDGLPYFCKKRSNKIN